MHAQVPRHRARGSSQGFDLFHPAYVCGVLRLASGMSYHHADARESAIMKSLHDDRVWGEEDRCDREAKH